VMEALGFEGSPEAFNGSIVIAMAFATHTGQHLMGVKQLSKGV